MFKLGRYTEVFVVNDSTQRRQENGIAAHAGKVLLHPINLTPLLKVNVLFVSACGTFTFPTGTNSPHREAQKKMPYSHKMCNFFFFTCRNWHAPIFWNAVTHFVTNTKGWDVTGLFYMNIMICFREFSKKWAVFFWKLYFILLLVGQHLPKLLSKIRSMFFYSFSPRYPSDYKLAQA